MRVVVIQDEPAPSLAAALGDAGHEVTACGPGAVEGRSAR